MYESLDQNRTDDPIIYVNSSTPPSPTAASRQILAPSHAVYVNWSFLDTAVAGVSPVSDEPWNHNGRHLEEAYDLPPPVPERHRDTHQQRPALDRTHRYLLRLDGERPPETVVGNSLSTPLSMDTVYENLETKC